MTLKASSNSEPDPIAKRLKEVPQNATIMTWLSGQQLYAHSDLAEELDRAAQALTDIQIWCPAPQDYSFYAMYRGSGILFAIAFGMLDIALRLPGHDATQALREGATALNTAVPDWITFGAFDAANPIAVTRERLRKYCRIAHAAAADT
jgi:hypothetical protein